MDTNVERDWSKQKQFGMDLVAFEDEMRACSKALRAHVEEARGSIQAENARVALALIIDLLDKIDASLPGVSEFGAQQIVLAHHIRDAVNFDFMRH